MQLRKKEVLSFYKEYAKRFEDVYNIIREFYSSNYVQEICDLRGYVSDEQKSLLKELEIGCCDIPVVEELGDYRKELGLVTKNDSFLLGGRYIIPVRDIESNLVALVGWYPDRKKYITTPSMFFSKELMFFNLDHAYKLSYEKYDGVVFVVEGMFDCLSLRAMGLPVIATMGSTVSGAKSELLKIFKKVIGIPDNDKVGRRSLNRYDRKYGWKVPSGSTMLKIVGGNVNFGETSLKVKDMDDFASWFEPQDVRDCLLQFQHSNNEIEDFVI